MTENANRKKVSSYVVTLLTLQQMVCSRVVRCQRAKVANLCSPPSKLTIVSGNEVPRSKQFCGVWKAHHVARNLCHLCLCLCVFGTKLRTAPSEIWLTPCQSRNVGMQAQHFLVDGFWRIKIWAISFPFPQSQINLVCQNWVKTSRSCGKRINFWWKFVLT